MQMYHQLQLKPIDVLFFRDGRPMEGASTGHGAAWPLPNIIDSALHHALHRAEFDMLTPHAHTPKRRKKELNSDRNQYGRYFGSLQTAGPFPINTASDTPQWLFPRPLDAQKNESCVVTCQPLKEHLKNGKSSLHSMLHPVINMRPPSKDKPEPWISTEVYQEYLKNTTRTFSSKHYFIDKEIFSAEHQIGIGIDSDTGAQDGEHIFSASYLRLCENIKIGVIASCMDKGTECSAATNDFLEMVFSKKGSEQYILVGGQQRICTVERKRIITSTDCSQLHPFPLGLRKSVDFNIENNKILLKWILLTPAIYPFIPTGENNSVEHQGGWLPNWIHPETLEVQLLDGPGKNAARRRNQKPGKRIEATLVAAITGKAIPVTGWALRDTNEEDGTLILKGGARATHLAVPAGSIYYFECDTPGSAEKLASALNWHGSQEQPAVIANRRSALLGEKGFGIGVCGTWSYKKS